MCSSQIIEFDPETRSYQEIVVWHRPDRLLSERRCSSTLIVGNQLLCLGGINKHGYCLKDLLCIDMETKEWKELSTKGEGPGHAYSMAMCMAAYNERDQISLNQLSDIKWDMVTQQISLEGIFVFGGIKGEIPDTRIQDNKLYRLTIGERQHEWSVVETTGPEPEARFQHAMHFIKSSNLIILIGGRRLGDSNRTMMEAEFIKDTHVLNMRTLEWSILQFRGQQLGGIYNFASCLTSDDDLYIFGGTRDPLHQNKKLFRIRDVVNSR